MDKTTFDSASSPDATTGNGDLTLEDKRARFNEYFAVKSPLNVNVIPLPEAFILPNEAQIVDHMPYAFQLASDISDIETKALRPLRNLSDHAATLAEYLNHQSRKIDLMMSYILRQEDDETYQYRAVSFGGSGLTLISTEPMAVGVTYELKIFLESEASAVFCYGEVIQCQQTEQGSANNQDKTCNTDSEQYNVSLIFSRIREQDQELLVRASLHIQAQQLRKTRQK